MENNIKQHEDYEECSYDCMKDCCRPKKAPYKPIKSDNIKQQVFDVLNEGGMIDHYGDYKEAPFNKWRIDWSHDDNERRFDYNFIPDDIETRMLDWLEEQLRLYKIFSITSGWNSICNSMRIEITKRGKWDIFCWDLKPRPVAIAEACVWVYKELNK